MLRLLELREVYDSADCDIVSALQVPLLGSSVSYLRGVGFFTSGWMRVAATGLQDLIENGGRGRIVVSPILDSADWDALIAGHLATQDEVLLRTLGMAVEEIAENLERDTRNTLAWMVAQDLLAFKFAVERNQGGGDYHDKVGVFQDTEGDIVAIHGSFNDSIKATLNGEAFSVFRSWIPGHAGFVENHRARLEMLWHEGNAQFKTFALPVAIKEQIVKLRHTPEAPYSVRAFGPASVSADPPIDSKNPSLYGYQTDAIAAWRSAGCRGMLEMATGTGKTRTALIASKQVTAELGVNVIVILVPYLHLMEQWGKDARQFGYSPVFCSGEDPAWHLKLRSALASASVGGTKAVCIIAVHKTAASDRFQKYFEKVKPDRTLIIADEAHGLGAQHMRSALLESAGKRLGLSATPRRWFDEEGTTALERYFGGVCFEMPLEKVIGTTLTPYSYMPILINLDTEESLEYVDLSRQIAILVSKGSSVADDKLRMLLLRRARIVGGAREKLPTLISLMRELMDRAEYLGEEVRDVLVYAPPGQHTGYLTAIAELGLRCHEFVHSVSLAKREEVLRHFAAGHIQVLVAIRCLDEGVDVPSTRTAFVLASSTNPREFVQRRGRILRKAPGKLSAAVYDFVVIGPSDLSRDCDDATRSLLRREMPRFAEFASSAENEFEARAIMRPALDRCEMLPLLDKRPWEVYEEMKEKEWELENV